MADQDKEVPNGWWIWETIGFGIVDLVDKRVRAARWFKDNSIVTGHDLYGIEYAVTEIGLQSKRGFTKINDGDYIVEFSNGEKTVMSEKSMKELEELVKKD